MSEIMIDDVPSSNGLITETDNTMTESGVNNDYGETWLYGNNRSRSDENIDNTTAPSIDEITTQEIDARETAIIPIVTTSLIGSQLDDDSDDDDDGIQVTIGNYEPEASAFQTNRQKNRMLPGPVIPPKPAVRGGVDPDAQGLINGQLTYEYDIINAYKDEEKPWKKPGADITDYFNYGFTEETWAQYCDRQRRLRAENNIARLNAAHMPPMLQGHPPMIHPMNPHPTMMINKPMNMVMMQRPMNIRKPDGKIDVIGSTDQTSRRPMFEPLNNFDHPPFINGPPFSGNQPPNGPTVGDLVSASPATNGHPPSAGAHHIQILGPHRLPMMSLPHGMQFRPQFGHPHAPGGPQFFQHRPNAGMHGERPPQPYFVPHHPQQPWDKSGIPPGHGFPPGPFPSQSTAPETSGNGRLPPSRSPTPENHSSRSSTPEENQPSGTSGDNEKASKDDRYKERYKDERDYHSSSRRRPSPKTHSSSSSYHTRHRSGEHEYERPRNDRKSSRDRDEHYSRKRHHRDDSRHHRGDDESSRNHRSSRRTPSKTPTVESSQTINEQLETSESNQPTSSSSRHSYHKKSSKRSRHDSSDERSNNHHHRHSKDKSNNKSTNQSQSLSDVKDQINE